MYFHKLTLILAILLGFSAAPLALLAQGPLPRDRAALRGVWTSPEFVQQFLGSYGFHGSQEPSITAAERDVLRRLVELIPQNLTQAADLLERSIRPDSSAALDFTLGNIYFQLDRLDAAERSYEAALRKFPNFLRAHKNLGMVRVRQDSLEPALASLVRALALGGADGITYGLIGYIHLQLDSPLSAESAYRQALLFESGNLEWKLGLARALQLQNRARETVALFAELIDLRPERPENWLYQANAFLAIGEPLRAAQNLEIVHRMGAATADSRLMLGDIYLNENLLDLAVTAYQTALTAAPGRAASRSLRAAEALAERGRANESRALLAALEAHEGQLEPADRTRRRRIEARLLLAENQASDAMGLLDQLLIDSPLDGEALLLLARAQATQGEPERAELTLERAADLPQFAAAAYRQLGELLVAQQQFDRALNLLRQAQAMDPRPYVGQYIEQVERMSRIRSER
jgi:tetratricopeptide (TPR) repeat protein